VWLLGLVFTTAISPAFVFLKTYVEQTGLGSVGGFFGCYACGAAILRVFFGWLPDRVGPRRVLIPAVGTVGAGLGLLSIADSAGALFLAGLLIGLGHGFTFPILVSLTIERAPPHRRGVALGVVTALFDAGLCLGGPLFGTLVTAFGYRETYTVAALLAGAGIVAFIAQERVTDSAPARQPAAVSWRAGDAPERRGADVPTA
jgi:MFS family permease